MTADVPSPPPGPVPPQGVRAPAHGDSSVAPTAESEAHLTQAEALRALAGDAWSAQRLAPHEGPPRSTLESTLAAAARAGRERLAHLAAELAAARPSLDGSAASFTCAESGPHPANPDCTPQAPVAPGAARSPADVARELDGLARRLNALCPPRPSPEA